MWFSTGTCFPPYKTTEHKHTLLRAHFISSVRFLYESQHDKTNKISVRPVKTQISLGIRPLSAQRRLWSVWVDAQADLSLRWAHTHFVGFVMSWLINVDDTFTSPWNVECEMLHRTTKRALSDRAHILHKYILSSHTLFSVPQIKYKPGP